MPAPTSMVRQGTGEETLQQAGIGGGGPDGELHTYYDVPMLKKPVWRWEIAGYFFLGGVSSGAFILSRLAERFGGEAFSDVTRFGAYASVAALVPCPALLIHDLGDKSRFHHMLRIWKPESPMNLGTWVITGFAPVAMLGAGREAVKHGDHRKVLPSKWAEGVTEAVERPGTLRVVVGSVGVLADAAGLPLALLLATYTGVLLSNMATPVWRQNKWISPMFAVGAMSTGASAISLALTLKKPAGQRPDAQAVSLKHFSTVAHAAEVLAFTGYLCSLRPEVRKPYMKGSMRGHTIMAFAGLVAAEVLKHIPVSRRAEKAVRTAGHLMSLGSALSMRWAVVHGAHESGDDPRAARVDSRSEGGTYAWLDEPRKEPREKTVQSPDPQAISTIDPALKLNSRHY